MSKKAVARSWISILGLTVLLEAIAVGLTLLGASIFNLATPDLLSLGQLVVALLLIPLAVVAFWEAREAVRASSVHPKLRMAFLAEDGRLHNDYTLRLPARGAKGNRITLAVENIGETVAVWWQVSFDLPLDFVRLVRVGNGRLGVKERQVPMMMDTVGDVERYVVQNTGTVALFPGPPIQIAIISTSLDPNFDHKFQDEYQIPFELLSDRAEPIRGAIPLKVLKTKE